jgi:hypothetical protein
VWNQKSLLSSPFTHPCVLPTLGDRLGGITAHVVSASLSRVCSQAACPLFLSHLLLSCQDEDPLILAAPSLAIVCGYKLCLVGSTLTEEAKCPTSPNSTRAPG